MDFGTWVYVNNQQLQKVLAAGQAENLNIMSPTHALKCGHTTYHKQAKRVRILEL